MRILPLALVAPWVGLLVACGPSGRKSVSSGPAAPRPAAAAAVEPPADAGGGDAPADAGASTPVRLEPLDASVQPSTHVEILFPFAEQRVLIPKASGYVVRLKIDGIALASEGAGVEIALDAERPRRVLEPNGIKLGDLTAEHASLSPGPHWLFAAAVDERGAIVRGNGGSRAPFAAVRFWVGDRPADAPPPTPQIVLFRPHGTLNGDAAADGALIDFLALPERRGVTGGAVRVRLTSADGVVEARPAGWQPLRVSGLPSGDFTIEAQLLDGQGDAVPGAEAHRTISVNRDVSAGNGS